MVGVVMRKKHRVHAVNAVGDALKSKLGGRVDKNALVAHTHEDARAGSPVARVGGRADRTVAADHRYAVRRAAAENDHFDW